MYQSFIDEIDLCTQKIIIGLDVSFELRRWNLFIDTDKSFIKIVYCIFEYHEWENIIIQISLHYSTFV